jgi:hypothetical protein
LRRKLPSSDAERHGQPVTVFTEENVARIQELLHVHQENPRTSTRDMKFPMEFVN